MENISKERYIVFKNLNLGELRTLKEKENMVITNSC